MGQNKGLRKLCVCPRRVWAKCAHPWHLNFRWKGRAYRFSLDRYLGRRVEGRTEAEREAERIRVAIREGRFGDTASQETSFVQPRTAPLSFRQLAERWTKDDGCYLASIKLDRYRLAKINGFDLRGSEPPVTFGDRPAEVVTLLDVEAYRDHRKASGSSAVTVNQDLRLLRKIFNWGIRKGLVTRTPFMVGAEPVIRLEREIPRDRRLESPEDEQRLLDAATPHLRAVITAILDTACRPGEILSLQWKDVSVERKDLVVRAEKSKTRTTRLIPVSSRLLAVLEMRRQGPDGQPHPPDAYVFGNEVGERVKSVRTAWHSAREAAGLGDLHLADLRHEAASRFDEAGMAISFVSTMLGHTSLTTTSRYLNVHRRGLHLAMEKYEEARRPANSRKEKPLADQEATSPSDEAPTSKQLIS